jgi:hypothetical protein
VVGGHVIVRPKVGILTGHGGLGAASCARRAVPGIRPRFELLENADNAFGLTFERRARKPRGSGDYPAAQSAFALGCTEGASAAIDVSRATTAG